MDRASKELALQYLYHRLLFNKLDKILSICGPTRVSRTYTYLSRTKLTVRMSVIMLENMHALSRSCDSWWAPRYTEAAAGEICGINDVTAGGGGVVGSRSKRQYCRTKDGQYHSGETESWDYWFSIS